MKGPYPRSFWHPSQLLEIPSLNRQKLLQKTKICSISFFYTFFGLFFSAEALVQAGPSYQPNPTLKVTESWRWHQFEQLKPFFIYTGLELPNENLLFATDKGLVEFDGYQCFETHFPEELQNIETFALWREPAGATYFNTSVGLIAYISQKWEILLEYEHFYPQSRPLFAKNENGLLVTGAPLGIYEINGNQVHFLAQYTQGVGTVISSNGKLFISPPQLSQIYSCDFNRESIRESQNWKKWNITLENYQGMFIFRDLETDSILAFNFLRNSGIYSYDPPAESWRTFTPAEDLFDESFFSAVSIDSNSKLFFAKSSTYLVSKNQYFKLSKAQFDHPSYSIFAFSRANGNIVLGGRGEAVSEIDLSDKQWDSYAGLHFFCEDANGHFWFLTKSGRVISKYPQSDHWIEYNDENLIDTPNHILSTSDGSIWVSGAHKGTAAVCRYDGNLWHRTLLPELEDRVGHKAAIELQDGRVLFGSGTELPTDRKGMACFTKNGAGRWNSQSYGPPIVPIRIDSFAQTKNGDIWASAFELSKLDPEFAAPFQPDNSLHTEWIDDIEVNSSGVLQVGIWEKGLYDLTNNGLLKNSLFLENSPHAVSSLLRDTSNPDTLWVATGQSISLLSKEDCVPDALPRELGMLREEGTMVSSSDGSIWINKTDRLWYFSNKEARDQYVSEFKTVRYRPESDKPNVKVVYSKANAVAPADVLIRWVGSDKWSITPTEQLRYSYKINESDWTPYSNETETILLNLPQGNHSFDIRVKDLAGNIANLDTPLIISVQAPIWKRPWFILGGIASTSIVILLLLLLIRQRVKHLLELDELKLQFFTNMSHELRTPLMLIIAPLESLIETVHSKRENSQVRIAHSNARKMLHLVDQILEFRKIEYGKNDLTLSKNDIVKHIREITEQLTPLAEEKSIQLAYNPSEEQIWADYDQDKFESVISNLINNAIKYSIDNGTIIVKCSTQNLSDNAKTQIVIKVEDDGVGIESEKLHHIFEPFYRISRTGQSRRPRGVGLGLPLVKNLLDSMGGEVVVESPIKIEGNKKSGARFTVKLNLEISEQQKKQLENTPYPLLESEIDKDEKIVLIVEDEKEIREYIGTELQGHFKIEYAENGQQALDIAKKIIPDLILSDVLMPEMDGTELCEKIRENESTSHIPIIVLTALKSQEHEMDLLRKGADDFLTKPVSLKVLRQKISNAIQSREKLQRNYREHLVKSRSNPSETASGSVDDKFVEKTKLLIEEHLDDPFFDVVRLSEHMGMSRMTLYRKIKAITGESPSELVRITRLKFAATLLLDSELNVSEIADRVGYQDLSHFSGSFKKHFGVSPSQYVRSISK